MYSTVKLYSKSTKNAIRFWQAHVICTYDGKTPATDAGAPAYIYTTYGQLNGKETTSKRKIVTGKNAGRSNSTTAGEQARLEVDRLARGKLEEGMKMSVEELTEPQSVAELSTHRVNVMLLHDYKKFSAKIKFPCYVQPKFDGSHFVVFYHPEIGVDAYTRGKTKPTAQLHITQAFESLAEIAQDLLKDVKKTGIYITGELWLPNTPRQVIESQVNQEKYENVKIKLNFNVFDCFWIGCCEPFSTRWPLAQEICKRVNSPYVVAVETKLVQDPFELEDYFQLQIKTMEGIVVRNAAGLYEYGIYKCIRSYDVQKYKNREDGEYKIVGVREGTGKFAGCAILVLETAGGKRFSATSPGTIEDKQKFWIERDTLIGRTCTVQYDGLSLEEIPQQPVIVSIAF